MARTVLQWKPHCGVSKTCLNSIKIMLHDSIVLFNFYNLNSLLKLWIIVSLGLYFDWINLYNSVMLQQLKVSSKEWIGMNFHFWIWNWAVYSVLNGTTFGSDLKPSCVHGPYFAGICNSRPLRTTSLKHEMKTQACSNFFTSPLSE